MPSKPKSKTAAVKPAPVTKTRINKDQKHQLLGHMEAEFDARIDDTELAAVYSDLVTQVNAMLRTKYPEADMPILRKYDFVHVDRCLRFTILGTDRVFGVRLIPPGNVRADIADIPCRGGCYTNEIFHCDKDFEILSDKWTNVVEARRILVQQKRTEYHAFLHACRYLEDVEAVLPISEELRRALGAQSRSLSVISPDVISRIKSDFAQGIAA